MSKKMIKKGDYVRVLKNGSNAIIGFFNEKTQAIAQRKIVKDDIIKVIEVDRHHIHFRIYQYLTLEQINKCFFNSSKTDVLLEEFVESNVNHMAIGEIEIYCSCELATLIQTGCKCNHIVRDHMLLRLHEGFE